MDFVRYNGKIAVIVKTGEELTADHPGSDLEDHLGVWFGEANEEGKPIVYTIPAEYVLQCEAISPNYVH